MDAQCGALTAPFVRSRLMAAIITFLHDNAVVIMMVLFVGVLYWAFRARSGGGD